MSDDILTTAGAISRSIQCMRGCSVSDSTQRERHKQETHGLCFLWSESRRKWKSLGWFEI